MKEYGKILDGSDNVRCTVFNWQHKFSLLKSDTQPQGYLPIEKHLPKPTPNDNQILGWDYTINGNKITKDYVLLPKGYPRQFSKLKFVEVMMNFDKWETVKQWIIDNGLFDLYQAAQDFSEDNVYYIQGKEQLKSLLGLSDDEINQIENYCQVKD